MITGEELKRRFLQAFDEEILKNVAYHVHDAYADSCERSAFLDREFRRHAIPQLRHYSIQSRVRHLAKRFDQIKVMVRYSPTGTEPYSVLQIDNFLLTISMVKQHGLLPRYSDFRKEESSINLFSDADPDEEERYYAILTHVPSPDNSAPEHMSVLFPYGGCSGSFTSINLDSLIAFDLDQTAPVIASEIIDLPEPILRKRIAKPRKEA